MKPIVIYADEKDNVITMSKAKFEELISQAYESGLSDAKGNVAYNPLVPNNNPMPRDIGQIPIRYIGNQILESPYDVTCKNIIPPEPAPPDITYQYESFHKCKDDEF